MCLGFGMLLLPLLTTDCHYFSDKGCSEDESVFTEGEVKGSRGEVPPSNDTLWARVLTHAERCAVAQDSEFISKNELLFFFSFHKYRESAEMES